MPAKTKPRLVLFKKFFTLSKAFFNGAAKRQARLWLAALLALSLK